MNIQPNAPPIAVAAPSAPMATQQIGKALDNVKGSLTNTFDDFSNQASAGVGATTEFLTSNTIIAKFAFILLILVVFLILFNLGLAIIGYFTEPPQDPYLVNGMIDGTFSKVVKQDPKQSNSIQIFRSNDQSKGMEFTWSTWIYLNNLGTKDGQYQHIFSKGDGNFDTDKNLSKVNNAPGLYVNPMNNSLHIKMDTVASDDSNTTIDIDNIPIKKWVHIALRLQNTVLDVYINGVIVNRLLLKNTPKQNYGDVYICQNQGFSGQLSNLRYYSRALNVFEINSVVSAGPNLKVADDARPTGGFKYLSSQWYSSKY